MFLLIAIIFIVIGLIAGVLSVMFGFGGGFFVVPVLYWGFQWLNVPHEQLMHMAAGTSLTVMIFTAGNSCYFHHQRGNTLIEPFLKLLPTLILGTMTATIFTQYISTSYLRVGFTFYLFCIIVTGIYKHLTRDKNKTHTFVMPNLFITRCFGFIAGFVATILGVGGSTLTVPFFRKYHMSLINAAATASLLTIPISIIGAIGYVYIGYSASNLPLYSTGFVYWPAVIGMILGSFLGVPLGGKILNHMDDKWHIPGYFAILIFVFLTMII